MVAAIGPPIYQGYLSPGLNQGRSDGTTGSATADYSGSLVLNLYISLPVSQEDNFGIGCVRLPPSVISY